MSSLPACPITGAQFREIRLRLGLTQTEFADRLSISWRRVQQLEASERVSGPVAIAARLLDAVAGKRIGCQFGV